MGHGFARGVFISGGSPSLIPGKKTPADARAERPRAMDAGRGLPLGAAGEVGGAEGGEVGDRKPAVPVEVGGPDIAGEVGVAESREVRDGQLAVAADVRVAIGTAGIPVAEIGVLTDDGEFTIERDGVVEPLPDFAVDEIARLNARTKE